MNTSGVQLMEKTKLENGSSSGLQKHSSLVSCIWLPLAKRLGETMSTIQHTEKFIGTESYFTQVLLPSHPRTSFLIAREIAVLEDGNFLMILHLWVRILLYVSGNFWKRVSFKR